MDFIGVVWCKERNHMEETAIRGDREILKHESAKRGRS